ncbi:ATP-binding protein [Streptomyces sp. NBC_00555]|uniref:AAA family ATPase n=1 Tax=Streptomyces sp. NBC_00555 TaxID=2903662 RepID=UPI002256F2CA|nr:ATP-binding protein [Streptomyces sp. NBC_00555]MCX5015201.1 ATP-binding protein [Streptomyces sp. NBC_00555]
MDDRRPRLVLLCGLPGAGKTTVAKKLERELSAVRLCPDERLAELGLDLFDGEARDRIERRLWQHAQDLLTSGAVVILENGFWQRQERDEKRLRARALGVEVELRYLDVPIAELERRLALRNQEPGSVVLTPELPRECQTQFEAPTPAELDLFDPPLP